MKKGFIPVIIITIIAAVFLILYALGITIGLLDSNMPFIAVIFVAVVFLILFIMLTLTLIERIKEIKGEDKDDISKY
ncbi:membrane protein implicated in regulation of membrane protease activity [Clostridium pascui]|uniref:hypothetical protein n=1 Tax=Clostridium pascui TaxID=46609 RepID=UPI001958A5F2|nr:hypothetical protein [Clostridium pascui]MBM7871077.1 membrane protein implicated in regulation of membrane protease activity [Clostridium pascui]